MQSILAVVGAVSLQAGTAQDSEKLAERLHTRMQTIFGDELEKGLKKRPTELETPTRASEMTVRLKEGKPMRLRYSVPRMFRPEYGDPWPCLRFYQCDLVRLEPTVSGQFDRDRLRWSISPKFPPKLGLVFDTKTGKLSTEGY